MDKHKILRNVYATNEGKKYISQYLQLVIFNISTGISKKLMTIFKFEN